jgi:hypothetical protein
MKRAVIAAPLALLAFTTSLAGQGVDAGVSAYTERGDAREAIRLLAPHAERTNPRVQDRLTAAVYLGHAFLALGDTVSALPHIQRAVRLAPCVLPTDDVPPAWRALYDRHRPANVSCGRKTASATLRSVLMPGWGQRSMGASGPANLFFLFTVGSAGGAGYAWTESSRLYDEYKASTSPHEVAFLYDQAETNRKYALGLGGAAAAFHVWNVVDAMRRGSAHDRELGRYRNFAATPAAGPSPDGLWLGLQISF